MKENPEDQPEKLPDRPLECGECKKPVAVHYTEVVGKTITHTTMCSDCPELQRRLQGVPSQQTADGKLPFEGGLACGNCGTTLEYIRVGGSVGCSECYAVFDDILINELLAADKVPARLATAKKSAPVHIGRSTGETQEMNSSLRLLALNEALDETLKREDYEQAAFLRDQIKELTEKSEESGDEGK